MFENLPYTDMHQLNLDWIIKIAKDFLDQYASIQQLITDGMEGLDNKAQELETLLQEWYDTHSEDIANQLADALNDIQNTLNTDLTNAVNSFNSAADAKAQQTIESIPSDYTAINNKIDNLERIIQQESGAPVRLADSFYTEANTIISSNGLNLVSLNGYSSTLYLPVISKTEVFSGNGFPASAYNTFVLYDSSYNVLYMGRGEFTVSVSQYPTAKYFRASKDSNNLYYVDVTENNYEYILSMINLYHINGMIPLDYFKNTGLISGDGTGIASNFTNYATTDYIPILSDHVYFYGRFFPANAYNNFVLYDENLTPLYMPHTTQYINIKDYPTAKYFRASYDTNNTSNNISIGCKTDGIIMEVGSDKLFTRLRDGVENAIKFNHTILYVYPGTYNLADEFSTEIEAASGSSGIVLANNIEIFFLAGSYVKALFPVSNEYISTYFQPFRGMRFTLHNLNIEASNCRYAVHDEQASSHTPYVNTYDNCIMKMTSVRASGATFIAPQCIGGGLGEHGVINIYGGRYYSNGDGMGTDNEKFTISFHNGSSANCDSRINIHDVYLGGTFPGRFRFGYFGESTTKTIVLVSNCSMGGAIVKTAENDTALIDNIEITEWNNTIR